MPISLKVPLSRERVRKLKSGDNCLLSGVIYTARDAAHGGSLHAGCRPCGADAS